MTMYLTTIITCQRIAQYNLYLDESLTGPGERTPDQDRKIKLDPVVVPDESHQHVPQKANPIGREREEMPDLPISSSGRHRQNLRNSEGSLTVDLTNNKVVEGVMYQRVAIQG